MKLYFSHVKKEFFAHGVDNSLPYYRSFEPILRKKCQGFLCEVPELHFNVPQRKLLQANAEKGKRNSRAHFKKWKLLPCRGKIAIQKILKIRFIHFWLLINHKIHFYSSLAQKYESTVDNLQTKKRFYVQTLYDNKVSNSVFSKTTFVEVSPFPFKVTISVIWCSYRFSRGISHWFFLNASLM